MATLGGFFDNMARRSGEVIDDVKSRIGLGEPQVQTGGTTPPPPPPPGGQRAAYGADEPIRNPNVAKGTPSAEAEAFNASKAGNPGIPKAPTVASGLRGLVSKAGPLAAAAVPGVEAYDATTNIQAGENPLKSIGRASLRSGATLLGGALGGTLGSAVGPLGTVAGAAGGGTLGYKAGDMASNYLFGPEPVQPVAPRGAPVQVGDAAPAPAPTGPLVPVNSQPGEPQGVARPEALMAPNSTLVPATGYGGFKRTTPGNEGPAVGLGDGSTQVVAPVQRLAYERQQAQAREDAESGYGQGGQGQGTVGANGLRDIPVVRGRGVTKFKADAINAQNAVAARGQDATLQAAEANRALQRAQFQRTNENERQTQVEKGAEEYVRGKNPAVTESKIPGSKAQQDYEASIKQQSAQLTDRLRHTASITPGVGNLGRLSESQQTLLHKGNDFRERLEEARKSNLSWAQDFFGTKRFDSKNLYSYLPAREASGAVKPAIPEVFGYSVEMGNGNKVKVYKLAGGGFNFTGPNDAVDSDAMELMKPAIDAAAKARR